MVAASNIGVDIQIDTMLQRNHGKALGGYYLQLQLITLPRKAVSAQKIQGLKPDARGKI